MCRVRSGGDASGVVRVVKETVSRLVSVEPRAGESFVVTRRSSRRRVCCGVDGRFDVP